jgi:hypothetical protein
LILGELSKLVLVERLFGLTRGKLMRIPAFALAYTRYREIKTWLKNTEAWQALRALAICPSVSHRDQENRYAAALEKPVAASFVECLFLKHHRSRD